MWAASCSNSDAIVRTLVSEGCGGGDDDDHHHHDEDDHDDHDEDDHDDHDHDHDVVVIQGGEHDNHVNDDGDDDDGHGCCDDLTTNTVLNPPLQHLPPGRAWSRRGCGGRGGAMRADVGHHHRTEGSRVGSPRVRRRP